MLMQLLHEDFAFEAAEDIIDTPGPYMQPGVFTILVGDLVQRVQLDGDPLLQSDWVPVDIGLKEVPLPSVNGTGEGDQLY